MSQSQTLYPLTFEPELKDKIWGGRKLESVLGKELPPDTPIGESWEVHGGSVVATGPYAGRTLDDLVEELGVSLTGSALAGPPGRVFPLLFKYIDASEVLSVQVHPDDEYAQERAHYPYGKTEAWYIIHADPGAQLVHGWRRPANPEQVEVAVQENRLERLLEYIDVSAGDVVFVPAGTVHAIGGGIVLAEIQQSSDITYRLYDWGRVGFDGKPRELHVQESLETLNYDVTRQHKVPSIEIGARGTSRRFLVACRYFAVESLEGSSPVELSLSGKRFEILSVLDGAAGIAWSGGEVSLAKGRTALLPAGMGDWKLVPDGSCRVLRMYPPDLAREVFEPLARSGCTKDEITPLGGDPKYNDLMEVRL